VALSESRDPGFNHSIIEEACKNVSEVIALLFPPGQSGTSIFAANKLPVRLQQLEASFFKNLPMSQPWTTHLPEFVCSEIESMLKFVEQSAKASAFDTFLTIARIIPLLLIRESFEEVDAMNKQGKWFQAFVVHATPSIKKIHFMGWQKSHDEDIPCDLWESRIRPRSAACDIGPRGKETSDAVKQVYGIGSSPEAADTAALAGGAPASAISDATAINHPASPSFLKYMEGFGDLAKTTIRSFLSRLPPRRIVSFSIELLAFMRVSSMKFCEIFNFELMELVTCECASAFTKATSDVVALQSLSTPSFDCGTLFSNIETDILEFGRRFNQGEDSSEEQLKRLCESLSTTARGFIRKLISSMSPEILQFELTCLINSVFSLHDGTALPPAKESPDPVVASEKANSNRREHIFHIFRIMSEISEHSSAPSTRAAPTACLKAKQLICNSMATAVMQCARSRGASDLSSMESQLIALSVAVEWLSLTTSGQVQNGSSALPITFQSSHPYGATAHNTTHDVCIPGAVSLKVHFSKKSETSDGHSLTFTSCSMPKPQVYSKKTWAGVDPSPKLLIDGDSFTATFHGLSSSAGSAKWGYSFTVTPVFPDLSSLLLLPLRVTIAALCFGSMDALLASRPPSAAVNSPETPCLVVSLIDEVQGQSLIGQRFQHLIRGPNSLIHICKEFQESISTLLAQAHAVSSVHFALPHVIAWALKHRVSLRSDFFCSCSPVS
jgi:hypothetical protein